MKTKKTVFLQIVIALGFLAGGCADDGFDYYDQYYQRFGMMNGFQVMYADPTYNQEYVPLNKEIRVTFNEQVDSSSAVGSIRVSEIFGSSSQDITNQGTLSFTNGNTTLVWSLSRGYSVDAKYEMVISSSLRSMSGRNLVGQAVVPFYTGSATDGNYGTITVSGPPVIQSLNAVENYNGAFVTFNEDLVYNSVPMAWIEVEDAWLFGATICPEQLTVVEAVYNVGNRLFFVHAPPGCWLMAGYKVKVRVEDAIDIQGERGSSSAEDRVALSWGG